MNYEKVKEDYKKRYASKCERIYFMGKNLILFKGQGEVLGCSVSVGNFLAMEKRDDERLCVQFSRNDKFITVNASELIRNNDNEIFSTLLKVKEIGGKIGGARMLFYQNSKLHAGDKELLLSALEYFCENIPGRNEIFRHFGMDDAIMMTSCRENYFTFFNGNRIEYLPFCNNYYKIVLCHIRDRRVRDFFVSDTEGRRAVELLRSGDYWEFGRILNRNTEYIIERNGLKATKNLYSLAVKRKECIGCGVLEDGGVFALIKNDDVDFFVRNLSMEYRRYFGAAPEFYVTDTETNGMIF